MEALVSIGLGVGLSAACGFRVFVPLLALSAAALGGHVPLAPGFAWIGTWPACLGFGIATLLEIAAYYVPWVDHALDVIAGPSAVIAGVVVSASVLVDLPPFVRWALALIAGGGAAATVQGTTTALRAASGLATAGIANPIISTLELAGAAFTVLLALLIPLLILGLLALLLPASLWYLGRRRKAPPAHA